VIAEELGIAGAIAGFDIKRPVDLLVLSTWKVAVDCRRG
jgi:hypothetical protein